MRTIYYISANEHKRNEVQRTFDNELRGSNYTVETLDARIDEVQDKDMRVIAEKKAIAAFAKYHRPIFVEQTGLLIKSFGMLPGGLTQVFWDALHAEKFAQFFVSRDLTEVIAKTVLAYCDGYKVHCFEGETEGSIVEPRLEECFQWDCVFKPDGSERTFAEMELSEKNRFSMRKRALEKFAKYLEETYD